MFWLLWPMAVMPAETTLPDWDANLRLSTRKDLAMKNAVVNNRPTRMTLNAETAADLMTPNPVSIREEATVREAVALLTDKGFSASPVIDEAGRPVGVLSRSDILVHDREKVEYLSPVPEIYHRAELMTPDGEVLTGFQVEKADQTRVGELMTPVIFSVTPESSVARVVSEMVSLKVHRLFVVDDDGVLVGVISAIDVLRHLTSEKR
jgi:CBS domain-containing protein